MSVSGSTARQGSPSGDIGRGWVWRDGSEASDARNLTRSRPDGIFRSSAPLWNGNSLSLPGLEHFSCFFHVARRCFASLTRGPRPEEAHAFADIDAGCTMQRNQDTPYVDPELYDLVYSWYDADLAFYLETARAARGPVLEAACGTGRVLIPTREAGVDIDGFDREPAMLERLRAKAACRGL